VSDCRRRWSLRRRVSRLCWPVSAAALTGALAAGTFVLPASAARTTLGPDPSPARSLAGGGLEPDAFAPAGTAAGRIVAGVQPPTRQTHPTTPRIQPLRLRPTETVTQTAVVSPPPVQSSPPSHASVTPRKHMASLRARTRKPRSITDRSSRPSVRPPGQFLLALGKGLGFPSLGGAVTRAGASVEAPVRRREPTVFAALAFLVLGAASASFLSLAYRLHRERIEV